MVKKRKNTIINILKLMLFCIIGSLSMCSFNDMYVGQTYTATNIIIFCFGSIFCIMWAWITFLYAVLSFPTYVKGLFRK
jgi:hypothetical protein